MFADTSAASCTFNVYKEYAAMAPMPVAQRLCLLGEIVGPEEDKEAGRAPVEVALVLDVSGSMSGAKEKQLKQSVTELLDRLQPDDVVHVITYNAHATPLVCNANVGTSRDVVRRKIEGIRSDGNTNISQALEMSLDMLARSGTKSCLKCVFLYSDGQPNAGHTTPEEFRAITTQFVSRDVPLYTFGIGDDINEDLMQALADQSRGHYDFVTVRRIEELTMRALAGLCRVFGTRAELLFHRSAGVRVTAISAVPYDDKEPQKDVTVPVGELRLSSRRQVLLEVIVDPSVLQRANTENVFLGTLTLMYYSSKANESVLHSVDVSVGIAHSSDMSSVPRCPRVMCAVTLASAANALNTVTSLLEAGSTAQARSLLEETLQALERVEAEDTTGHVATMLRRGRRTMCRLQVGDTRRVQLELGHQRTMMRRMSDCDMAESDSDNVSDEDEILARPAACNPPRNRCGRKSSRSASVTDSGSDTSSDESDAHSRAASLSFSPVATNAAASLALPPEFLCPLTHDVMNDPVVTSDGHTYERSSIERWFADGHTTSPLTNVALSDLTLLPNYALRQMIVSWKQ